MTWEQLGLGAYGIAAVVAYVVSLVRRAWRRGRGEG